MTVFQLFLMIVSAVIFYMFFRQLFSGDHPKRGVDFEAKTADEQIGGISRPDKVFSKPEAPQSRMEQLQIAADEAVEKSDYEEAKKALGSALILDPGNTQSLYKMAFVHTQIDEYNEAKEYLEKFLEIDDTNDMAHAMYANVLHKLGDSDRAIKHHEKSIEIDPEYAPHYFNYANTLNDIGRRGEALELYRKAYELDPTLDDAKTMIDKLSE